MKCTNLNTGNLSFMRSMRILFECNKRTHQLNLGRGDGTPTKTNWQPKR